MLSCNEKQSTEEKKNVLMSSTLPSEFSAYLAFMNMANMNVHRLQVASGAIWTLFPSFLLKINFHVNTRKIPSTT